MTGKPGNEPVAKATKHADMITSVNIATGDDGKQTEMKTAVAAANPDDLFYIARDEVNQFNFFLLNNNITKENENVLGAVKDIIRFLLLHVVVQYDMGLNAFGVKSVQPARVLLVRLKSHLPLFEAFDANKIKKASWGLNAFDKATVRIMVKVDSITSESLQKSIKKAVNDAKMAGWGGKLEIITASPVISTLP